MHSKECEIVRDLISIRGQTSRAARRMISDHIRTCPECRALWERAQSGFTWPTDFPAEPFAQNSSRRYFRWTLETLGLLICLVSLIVNYAVDKHLTWCWITIASIACCIIPVIIYWQTRRMRFLKALSGFSILVPLLLGAIQLTVLNGMGHGGVWFWRVAVPVSAVWLAAVWIGIIVALVQKRSGFDCLALVFLLFIPAYIATCAIAVAYTGDTFSVNAFTVALLALFAAAMYMIGLSFQHRQRGRNRKA